MKKLLVCLLLLGAWPAYAQVIGPADTYQLRASPIPAVPSGLAFNQFGAIGVTANRYYWVSALYPQGESRFAGPVRPLGGPVALSATNFFRLSWAPAPGALTYNVVRTATAAYPMSGNILVSNTANTFAFDQGAALGAWVAPSTSPPPLYSLSSGRLGTPTISEFNTTLGYQFDSLAPLGNVLRGDDTHFVSAKLNYSDLNGTPASAPGQNGLISGGEVAWAGNLVFTVSAATYGIAGTQYSSAQTNITLDPADAVNDRIDVIAVDNTGTVLKITGTPGAPPSPAWVDPSSQLQLTFIYVAALATVPSNVIETDLYLEGAGGPTEWIAAKVGAAINLTSASNPYAGTKDIEAVWPGADEGNYITLTKPAGTLDLSDYNTLVFYIRVGQAWNYSKTLVLTWWNGLFQVGSAVTFKDGTFNFSGSLLGSYQQIVIPLISFAGHSGALVKTLKIQIVGPGPPPHVAFNLDNIELQGGIAGFTLPANLMIFRGPWSATTSYAPNDVVTSGTVTWIALTANVNVTPVAGTDWARLSNVGTGSGSVTNVATSAPLSGGPITTTGTISVTGAAGQVLAGATPAFTPTPALGTDNSVAGTLTLANGSAAAHTILGSGATTTNTIKGFATAPTTGHLVSCTTSGTTCTLTDAGPVAQPYDVASYYPGIPGASQIVTRVTVPRVVVFPVSLTDSYATAGTAATASTVFDIQKNGAGFGTVTFAMSGTTGTFASGAGSTFAAGDVLSVVGPSPADVTLADISITITGTR